MDKISKLRTLMSVALLSMVGTYCILSTPLISLSRAAEGFGPQKQKTHDVPIFTYDGFIKAKGQQLIQSQRSPNPQQEQNLKIFFNQFSSGMIPSKTEIPQILGQIDSMKSSRKIVGEQAQALKEYVENGGDLFLPIPRGQLGNDRMLRSYKWISEQNKKIVNDPQNRQRLSYDVLTFKKSFNELPKLKGGQENTILELVDQDTIDAAKDLARNYRTAILNFANRFEPGGGYLEGELAQEEDISRRTTLFPVLNNMKQKSYPIQHDEVIYSKDIKIFRDSWKNGFNLLSDPLPNIDVITMGAYNLNSKMQNNDATITDDEYKRGTKDKIRAQLRIAAANGDQALVLGAFGCGVFAIGRQDIPPMVAKLYKEVLEEAEFKGVFKVIRFAILDQNSANYQAFKDELKTIKWPNNRIK